MRILWAVLWGGCVLMVAGFGMRGGVARGEDVKSSETRYDGITKPSEERELNFNFAGIVREVLVKEGDAVKVGQVLMAEDDRIERKVLEGIEVEANSELKIEYAKFDMAQKRVTLDRIANLRKQGAASPSELEEATLGLELATKRVQLAQEELSQKKLEAAKQRIKIELMHLGSTIEGIVQKIGVKAGEVADPSNMNKPACVVVTNDPLKVEVHLPTMLASKLKMGQVLEVKYPDRDKWEKGKVIFFDPVADAGSGTRLVQVELPNPSKRESGWQVEVRVPGEGLAER